MEKLFSDKCLVLLACLFLLMVVKYHPSRGIYIPMRLYSMIWIRLSSSKHHLSSGVIWKIHEGRLKLSSGFRDEVSGRFEIPSITDHHHADAFCGDMHGQIFRQFGSVIPKTRSWHVPANENILFLTFTRFKSAKSIVLWHELMIWYEEYHIFVNSIFVFTIIASWSSPIAMLMNLVLLYRISWFYFLGPLPQAQDQAATSVLCCEASRKDVKTQSHRTSWYWKAPSVLLRFSWRCWVVDNVSQHCSAWHE